jgi:hypothetical protein
VRGRPRPAPAPAPGGGGGGGGGGGAPGWCDESPQGLIHFHSNYLYSGNYSTGRSRDTVVGIATGSGLDDRGIGVLVPVV